MERQLRPILGGLIADALAAEMPPFTRRDVYVPGMKGKALAVVGIRRSGKTTFLWQCLADRLTAGVPREALVYLNFEDERLTGMSALDLQWIVEEYFAGHPNRRSRELVTFFFDEIQLVAGWESFVRRLLDTERVDVLLSGSSARLLSREVATAMRGRGLEVLVHPFSFREYLRHHGAEPDRPWSRLPKASRSALARHFRDYLANGGFPEAQRANQRDRGQYLRSLVDVALLRDVIDRHNVSNPAALRWMLRHLMANPAGSFSVQKFFDALKSQGLAVGKNTLHDYLGHLEDAFLVRTLWLHTASERQRMVNPRKAYPVDPGLIPVFERAERANLGHALETAVLLELERRGCQIGYLRTREGFEVDFHARSPEGGTLLIQVCADASDPATWNREIRALASAAADHPSATPLLLTFDAEPPRAVLPAPLRWQAAASWLLGEPLPAQDRSVRSRTTSRG
jgi:hypothetical protein